VVEEVVWLLGMLRVFGCGLMVLAVVFMFLGILGVTVEDGSAIGTFVVGWFVLAVGMLVYGIGDHFDL
jgi:hypothetical protein